jgi:MoaA/NifB/PqqE/SkfB family radical SAM enzyme
MGVDIINLSMDSLDKRTYERIRRVSFDKVMRNIDDLLAAKKPPTEVWVSAVDISFNKKTRAGFLKYWGSRADRVQITPYVRYPKVRNWRLPHKKAKDSARCQRLESDMVILSNGEAAKCCIDFEGATSFGNVAEKSLAAIWNGAGRADLLEEMRKSGRKKLYPCNICSI